MKTTHSRTHAKDVPSAEQIAELADAGANVTRFFSGNGRMMQPGQRINVDFTAAMIDAPYVAAAARRAAPGGSGLDGRHRDEDGRISEKHGNTLVSSLRETYGQHFLSDWSGETTLEKVRHATGKSLSELVQEASSAPRGRSFGGKRSETMSATAVPRRPR